MSNTEDKTKRNISVQRKVDNSELYAQVVQEADFLRKYNCEVAKRVKNLEKRLKVYEEVLKRLKEDEKENKETIQIITEDISNLKLGMKNITQEVERNGKKIGVFDLFTEKYDDSGGDSVDSTEIFKKFVTMWSD
jgi:predicted nuclease with TOPRIM domain